MRGRKWAVDTDGWIEKDFDMLDSRNTESTHIKAILRFRSSVQPERTPVHKAGVFFYARVGQWAEPTVPERISCVGGSTPPLSTRLFRPTTQRGTLEATPEAIQYSVCSVGRITQKISTDMGVNGRGPLIAPVAD